MYIKRFCIMLVLSFISLTMLLAQQPDRKAIRKGNREYTTENYEEAEVLYRKAKADTKLPFIADYNIAGVLYKQEKYEEALEGFKTLAGDESRSKAERAASYHNLGNSYLQAGKLEESIEAYKNALRQNPRDMETKYNLAFAQDKLKQQQQQQQQDQDQDQDENKDKDKDKEKKDENKDQQDNKDQNEDQQDKQQQPEPNEISKEDAERILQALQNDEKDVQEKVKKEKAAKAKVKRIINW